MNSPATVLLAGSTLELEDTGEGIGAGTPGVERKWASSGYFILVEKIVKY